MVLIAIQKGCKSYPCLYLLLFIGLRHVQPPRLQGSRDNSVMFLCEIHRIPGHLALPCNDPVRSPTNALLWPSYGIITRIQWGYSSFSLGQLAQLLPVQGAKGKNSKRHSHKCALEQEKEAHL